MGERPRSRSPRQKQEDIKKRKKRRKKRTVKRVIITLLILVLVGVTLAFGYMAGFLNDLNDKDLPSANKVSINETINVLLVGLDVGDVNQTENESIKRTDTIMVVNYNPDTKKVHLVSIPRDTLIKTNSGNNAKINAAYAIGGEEFLIEKVENLLEIDINYIVKIDYDAFRAIIDAIGGVDMYIERDMHYDDPGQNLSIHFNAGETVHLDGKGAEEFFRWRKNNDGTGLANADIGRIQNQQLLMKKVVEKCMSPSIVTRIPKILNAISENVKTNFDLNGMIQYAFEVIKINPENIAMTTLMGNFETIDGQSYVVYDRDMNLDILEGLKTGTSSLTSINKETVSICVLNATKTNGLAGDLKFELGEVGYSKVETGNAEQLASDSIIYTNSEELGNMLKEDISIKTIKSIPDGQYEGYDAVIIIGDDYNIFGG